MDRFPGFEFDKVILDSEPLPLPAEQMHFDPALGFIVKGLVREAGWIENLAKGRSAAKTFGLAKPKKRSGS